MIDRGAMFRHSHPPPHQKKKKGWRACGRCRGVGVGGWINRPAENRCRTAQIARKMHEENHLERKGVKVQACIWIYV